MLGVLVTGYWLHSIAHFSSIVLLLVCSKLLVKGPEDGGQQTRWRHPRQRGVPTSCRDEAGPA